MGRKKSLEMNADELLGKEEESNPKEHCLNLHFPDKKTHKKHSANSLFWQPNIDFRLILYM